MESKNIKSIIRGHLISVYVYPIKLKKHDEELFRTRYYSIIVGDKQVSFKQGDDIRTFKYDEVRKFYLLDNDTFAFYVDFENPLYFKIATPIKKVGQKIN